MASVEDNEEDTFLRNRSTIIHAYSADGGAAKNPRKRKYQLISCSLGIKRRKSNIEIASPSIANTSSYPIFIRTINTGNNKTLTFVVKDVSTINHIAFLVSNKIKIPTQNIILFYKNKQLSKGKTLRCYKIIRDSTLTATVRSQPIPITTFHGLTHTMKSLMIKSRH